MSAVLTRTYCCSVAVLHDGQSPSSQLIPVQWVVPLYFFVKLKNCVLVPKKNLSYFKAPWSIQIVLIYSILVQILYEYVFMHDIFISRDWSCDWSCDHWRLDHVSNLQREIFQIWKNTAWTSSKRNLTRFIFDFKLYKS